MKMLTIRMSQELHRKLKLLCVSLGISMGEFMISLIEKETNREGEQNGTKN